MFSVVFIDNKYYTFWTAASFIQLVDARNGSFGKWVVFALNNIEPKFQFGSSNFLKLSLQIK